MKKFKCRSIKGTQAQLFAKFIVFFILGSALFIFLLLNGYDEKLALLLLFAVIGLSVLVVFIPMRKYSAASVEITDKELRFFDKSDSLKYSIMLADIVSAKPEPHFNIYDDRDLNTKLTIKTQKGDVFTIFLPEEGVKAISELLGASVMSLESIKKIPLYMHLMFIFAMIFVPISIVLAIISPETSLNDTGDYVKFFIYIPTLIGFIIYYLYLRKKVKQK